MKESISMGQIQATGNYPDAVPAKMLGGLKNGSKGKYSKYDIVFSFQSALLCDYVMPNKMISFVSQHKSAFTFPCMKFIRRQVAESFIPVGSKTLKSWNIHFVDPSEVNK